MKRVRVSRFVRLIFLAEVDYLSVNEHTSSFENNKYLLAPSVLNGFKVIPLETGTGVKLLFW